MSDHEVKAIKAPKLFMVSENDEDPFVSDARHMYAIAGPPKEIHIYPGVAHGTDIFGGENGDDPAQRVLHFITQYAPASQGHALYYPAVYAKQKESLHEHSAAQVGAVTWYKRQ